MKNNIPEAVIEKIGYEILNDGIQKIVVGAVIVFDENRVLVVRRVSDDFMGGLVELPSGTADEDEGIAEALVREIKEETGLDVASIDSFVGTFDYVSGSGKKTRQVNFKVTAEDDEVVLSAEHDAFYVIPASCDEFRNLNISEHTRRIIEKALALA